MPHLSRRSLALGVAALPLFAIGSRPAGAAEFTYKFANNTPVTHPMNVRGQEAANRIKEATGGRLEIQLFPNNQLGSDTDMLSQLRSGAIEFFTLSGLILSTLVPPASHQRRRLCVQGLRPGLVGDGRRARRLRPGGDREARPASDGKDLGQRLPPDHDQHASPIKMPDDFKGVKLRVPVSPLWTSMFTALGASPASINFSEVYSALQTHIVDGQENPLNLIDTAKLYEVQKYCSLTNHMWDGFWFLANRRAWDRLPKDVQEMVEREIDAAALAERADIANANKEVRTALEGKGLVFNEVDTAAFRERLKQAGFYKEWRGKFGEDAWHVLEGSVGANLVTAAASAPAATRQLRLERVLAGAVEAAAAGLVLAEIAILLLGVIARFVFNRPIVWTDELASILFLWLAMLGSVIALQRGQHMRLTAIVAVMPPAWQARAGALATGAAGLFLAAHPAARGRIRAGRMVHRDARARLVQHDPRRGASGRHGAHARRLRAAGAAMPAARRAAGRGRARRHRRHARAGRPVAPRAR